MSYFGKYFSLFISAYRKIYSTQQVLIRWLEEWGEKLDKNFIVGTVLMDLNEKLNFNLHISNICRSAAS